MQKILFSLFIFLQFNFSAFALSGKTITDSPADKIFIFLPGTTIPISLTDFVKLDAKGFKTLTGKKLSLVEKISFTVIQKKIRRSLKKNETINIQKLNEPQNDTFKFDMGGFILGLVLWLPGLIIAAIMDRKKKPKNIFKSAVIGFTISTALLLVLLGTLISEL